MSYLKFTLYEVAGAIIWVVGIVGGAHYLGKKVDFDIAAYFHYFVILLMILIISPFFLKFFKNKRK